MSFSSHLLPDALGNFLSMTRREEEVKERPGIMPYKPSIALTSICLLLYLAVAIAQTWRFIGYRAKYMLAMIIGAYVYTAGIALRYQLRSDTFSTMIYAVQFSLVSLSPCAMIATIYALLSRLAINLDAQKYLPIRARLITVTFVCSDVFTFLVQGSGGGLMSGGTPDKADLGKKLFLIGLIAQGISFILFSVLFALFFKRAASDAFMWTRDAAAPRLQDWRSLAYALAVTCICVIIRSIYRIAEANFIGNHTETDNWLTGELAFYLLDALPIFIALALLALCWPGMILRPHERLPTHTSEEYYALGANRGMISQPAGPIGRPSELTLAQHDATMADPRGGKVYG